MNCLTRHFFEHPTLDTARNLLGKVFFDRRTHHLSGRIVEVEAYIGRDDPDCHARFGQTERNAVMFGPGGVTYVYFIYGMYDMLNFVTEPAGRPAAVLIRALEPLSGLEIMRKNRGIENIINLTNGPGKLCRAFGLTTKDSGIDLTGSKLFVADDGYKVEHICESSRIGIKVGQNRKWRFYIAGNKYVSKV